MAIVSIDPATEKFELATPGKYGPKEGAILKSFEMITRKDGAEEATFKVGFTDPKLGSVVRTFRVRHWEQGSKVPRYLRQLGVTDEQMGTLEEESLNDTPIIFEMTHREWTTKDGTRSGVNEELVNIFRLQD